MPRIRTVKPEFWRSPDVIELDDFQQLLYIGLWNFTDDEGRGAYNPTAIAADIFLRKYALDPRGVTHDIEEAFKAYAERDMVTVYRVRGRDYYQINNWHSHQKINRPQKSKIPPLDQAEHIIHGAFTEHSVNDHGGISEGSLRDHGAFTDRSLREGKGSDSVNVHGTLTESAEQGDNPAPFFNSVDALADAHAQEQTAGKPATGVHGTIEDPRCTKHKDLDRAPACWDCKKAGDVLKTRAEAEKQARLDAITNCDLCDENGMREVPGGLTRCNHQPEEDTPPWEKHA